MTNEASSKSELSSDAASQNDDLRALQVVRAGSLWFGVFADEIATIVSWQDPTPLPHAASSVLGVVSIQGRMLTVLELTALAGREAGSNVAALNVAINNDRRILALRGDEQLALAVDALGDAHQISIPDIKLDQTSASNLSLGVLRVDESEISVLNLRHLFPVAIQGRERRRRRF